MQLLLAQLQARPDQAETLAQLLNGLAEASRSESGCLQYAVHQALDDAAQFVVYELYADIAARDAHLARPEVQAVLSRFDTLLAAPPRLCFGRTLARHQA